MLKGQRKVNVAGSASCIGLLLLAFLLINPLIGDRASALEEESISYDNQASVQAGSGVTISFTPSSGSASLTPTTSDGASAKINISANVQIASTGGYTVYLGGQNSALTGERTGEAIAAMSGSRVFDSLETNTWGYAAVEGLFVPDTATYSALPQGQGVILSSVNENQVNVDRTYALSFATKIGNDKPADTYSNQVTLSVTSSPLQASLIDITTMQEMTSFYCSGSKVGDEVQLKDTRDGKYYWVGKMADGRCWMTQNLDLDLSVSKSLSSVDTDLGWNGSAYPTTVRTWTPSFSTASRASSDTVNSDPQTETRSWSLGNYRVTNPTASSNCGHPKSSAADCSSQFTAYTTPTTANGDTNAHYILGNHYSWNTATAGTGGSITSGQAPSSICPRGWKLPESGGNVATAGSFEGLVSAGSIGSDTVKLTSAPYYFARGGYVNQSVSHLFYGAGDLGLYWSSTPDSSSASANLLLFGGTNRIDLPATLNRQFGLSVRCVAR